ncbi:MAG: subclass B3 metallo-beta-lactamase [Pseudomonadota bacterium]
MKWRAVWIVVLAILTGCAAKPSSPFPGFIDCRSCEQWNAQFEPFLIYGNTYYVGVAGLSSILINGGDGLILIDGGLPQSAPIILQNIRALGFDPKDVALLLVSHVHYDHVGGTAYLQAQTGAPVLAHPLAVPVLRSATMSTDDPQFSYQAPGIAYPPVTGEILADNFDSVRIGDIEINGVFTPGHTPSGMSWTWRSCVGERCLDIVYADSLTPVSGDDYRFTDGLGDALRQSAETVATLPCDIFLSTHGFTFDLAAKRQAGWHAFIDGDECVRYSLKTLGSLERRLEREAEALSESVD